jgi:uncharacterized membrane protein
MIPCIVLVAVFLCCWLLGLAGVATFSSWQLCLRIALAVMFLLTASAHWGKRRGDLLRMVPPTFANPGMWVTLTGIAEIAGAAGLLWTPTRKAASIGLSLMLLAVFPANVRAAREHLTIDGRKVPGLAVRTLMQLFFLGSVVAAGWW